MRPDAVEALAKRVRDAAAQRVHLLTREADQRSQAAGRTLVYSIDTDIVHLYVDPTGGVQGAAGGEEPGAEAESAPRHYTHIFEGDSDELSVALGKRITEFIFFRLADQAPILVLPSVQREIARVFMAIATDASSEQQSVLVELGTARESVAELADKLHGVDDLDARLDLLLEDLPKLRAFLFGFGGPSMELSRFTDLLDRCKLADLDRLGAFSASLGHAEREALSVPTTIYGMVEFTTLKDRWRDRLTEMKSSKVARRNVESDCEVLAKLELVNRAAPDDLRVVHITGDRAIFRAAELHPPAPRESYARRWLRDPRAFLAEPEVLFPDGGEQSLDPRELAQWLDVFLGEFTDGLDSLPSNLETLSPDRELVTKGLSRNPASIDDFDGRWGAFCQTMALDLADAARVDSKTPVEELHLALIDHSGIELKGEGTDLFDQLEDVLASLHQLVDQRVETTWLRCFDAATKVGFTLASSSGGTERSRYAPPLMFADFAAASAFFAEMISDVPSPNHDDVLRDFEDADIYVRYLVFAGLFGAQGRWHPARVLASRAVASVGSEKYRNTQQGRISGREAHYLMAICQRLTARSVDDLAAADRSLKHAYAALAVDKESNREHPVTDLRFKSEEIAMRVSRCLFRRFVEDGADAAELLGDWGADIRKLLGRVDGELADPQLRDRVAIALQVNYLMALIASDGVPVGTPRDAARLEDHVSVLAALRETASRMGNVGGGTYLVRSVLLAATAALDAPAKADARRQLVVDIRWHFADDEIKANRTTIYDQRRFRFLRDFALGHLDRRRTHGQR